ncbi:MAG: trigger factor, partial [Chloroflexi bacterium]|nr:trigger factor [Chloroflexota bacterium]
MKVETEELPNSEVALSFEIEDSRLQRAMDAAAKRLAGRINIAGFRRGKAPRALVERVVGKEAITEEALEDLLPTAYKEALGETGILALTDPQFNVESVNPFKATATVVVPPHVELGDYRSIQHDPPSGSVGDEQVDQNLQLMRGRNANWVPAERPAAMDDMVVINVLGKIEDRVVIDEVDVDYLMIPARTVPVPGFAEAIVGLAADEERTFDLLVPEDHDNKELAGKTVAFQVRGKEIRVKELPELDDYFASTVSDFATLEELRAHIHSELSEQAAARAQEQA